MIIKIEKYRGFEINYDDDKDSFVSDLFNEEVSRTVKRKSLSDLRKAIDDFIKDNLNFTPFYAFCGSIDFSCRKEGDQNRFLQTVPHKVKIIGIKKGGGIFYISKDGKKEQLNNNSYSDDRLKLFIYSPEAENTLAEVAAIEVEIDNLKKRRLQKLKNIEPLDLSFANALM